MLLQNYQFIPMFVTMFFQKLETVFQRELHRSVKSSFICLHIPINLTREKTKTNVNAGCLVVFFIFNNL